MNPLCIDCAKSWRDNDGILMCGRIVEATMSPVARYCFAERYGPPRPGEEICGPRARYFELKS